jgi:hypothetical protein
MLKRDNDIFNEISNGISKVSERKKIQNQENSKQWKIKNI